MPFKIPFDVLFCLIIFSVASVARRVERWDPGRVALGVWVLVLAGSRASDDV